MQLGIERPPILAPKKAKNLGKTSDVVRDRKSSIFGSKKGKKMGKIPYVVRDRKSSNF